MLQVAAKVAESYGTPTYLYDAATLKDSARKALNFPNAYGVTVRYAMKASPNAAILKVSREVTTTIRTEDRHTRLLRLRQDFGLPRNVGAD